MVCIRVADFSMCCLFRGSGSAPVTMREFRLAGLVMVLLFCAVAYMFTTHIGRSSPEGSLATSIAERVDQSVFRAVERQVEYIASSDLTRASLTLSFLQLKSMDPSLEKKYPVVAQLPRSKRQRIMVTGGAGFVGSHLVDRLMEQVRRHARTLPRRFLFSIDVLVSGDLGVRFPGT